MGDANTMNHSTNWTPGHVGEMCWLSDPEQAYLEGRIESVSGNTVTVSAGGRSFNVDLQAPLRPPTRGQREPPRRLVPRVERTTATGVENMDDLPALNEASILNNIEHRFRMDKIYTRSGPILIAMNPFKWLPIYGDEITRQYHNRPYGQLPPHCYQEAEHTYVKLKETRLNQAVVICGESGAGKTETTKLMLKYLSDVAAKDGSCRRASLGGVTMGEKMSLSNPLMEAFGNAKTTRNNNSSRFGKFTMYNFDEQFNISGGRITNFLLEKSRVTFQAPNERNFHIFYQLLAGASSSQKSQLGLTGTWQNYAYTARNDPSVLGMDDREEFQATIDAMEASDVGEAEQMAVYKLVAAVLHLGNVQFDAAGSDNSNVSGASNSALSTCSGLLQVDAGRFGQALTCRVLELPGGQTVRQDNTKTQSEHLRDATAKGIYTKVFDWMVNRVNETFDRDARSDPSFIGVLDIFGFEDMAVNGFEQLFINSTNEQLQKLFNDIIFRQEEEEYNREQIQWDKTVFPDNTPCIEMLVKKPIGLLPFIDSECSRGQSASDNAQLVAKFNRTHAQHPNFDVCGPASVWKKKNGERTDNNNFLVHHYAGPIIYTAEDYIDKNRDFLSGHVHDIMTASGSEIMRSLFEARSGPGGQGKQSSRHQTVATRFLGSLYSLLDVLRASESRFVRCIKTNEEFQPHLVDKMSVLRQLVCSGVMAALEVRRAGFPSRMTYREFVREFRAFTPHGPKIANDKDLAAGMLRNPHVTQRVQPAQWRLGVTKVFMQADVLHGLYTIKNRIIGPYVRRLQRWWISKQGSIMQHKVMRCANDLARATSEAEMGGVAHVPGVRRALDAAADALARAQSSMSREDISAAVEMVQNVKAAVEEAVRQKEEAYRIRAELLTRLDACSARLQRVKDGTGTLYDANAIRTLQQHTGNADEKLNSCREHLIQAANRWDQALLDQGPSGAQGGLRRAATRANMLAANSRTDLNEDPAVARERKIEEAVNLVGVAEALFEKMLEDKRRVDEARAEVRGVLDAALDRLNGVDFSPFIIAGVETVTQAVSAAHEEIGNAQRALRSVDPNTPYREAVQAAVQAVDAALGCVARENARLMAIEQLDQAERHLRTIILPDAMEHQLQDAPGFAASVAAAEDGVASAAETVKAADMATFQLAVANACMAVQSCQDNFDSALAAKRKADKQRFNKLLGMWGQRDAASTAPAAFRKNAHKGGLVKVGRRNSDDEFEEGGPKPRFQWAIDAQNAVRGIASAPAPAAAAPAPSPAAAPAYASAPAPAPVPQPMSPVASGAYGGGELGSWIDEIGMTKYKGQLMQLADTLQDFKEMTDADVSDIVSECGIPKMTARRFRRALQELGAQVTIM